MLFKPAWIFSCVYIVQLQNAQAKTEIRFNTLNCFPMDGNVFKVDTCFIKLQSRKISSVKISANLKMNISKLLVHVRFMKKQNGWHPFLYDLNVDTCDFLKNPSKYAVLNAGYSILKNYTNVQHKCPYLKGEHIFLDFKLPDTETMDKVLKLFPVDTGEYGIFVDINVGKRKVGSLNASASYMDYAKLH